MKYDDSHMVDSLWLVWGGRQVVDNDLYSARLNSQPFTVDQSGGVLSKHVS